MISRRSQSIWSAVCASSIFISTFVSPVAAHAHSDLGVVIRDRLIEKAAAQLIAASTDRYGNFARKLKPIDEKIDDIDLSKLPDIAKIYGTNFFGIDDQKDFDLKLRYFDAQFSVKPKLADVSFEKMSTDRAELSFTVQLDDVSILIPKLWIKEEKFSNQYSGESPKCFQNIRRHPFFRDRVYGEVRGLKLFEADPKRNPAPPLQIKVVAEVDLGANPKKSQIKIKSTRHNVDKIVDKHYELTFSKINLPPMKMEINGECFDIDQKPIEDWIRSDLEKIKVLLINSIMKALVTGGVKNANALLAQIRFRPEVAISNDDPLNRLYEFKPITTRKIELDRYQTNYPTRDATSVNARYPREFRQANEREEKPIDAFKKILDSFFLLRYTIGLHHLDWHSKSEFAAYITEALNINGHASDPELPEITIPNFENMPDTREGDFVIAISTGMLKDKFSIIQRIRLLEKKVFPKGITLSSKGVELHRLNSNTLALVANTVIDLGAMDGFGPWLGNAIENIPFISKTGGVLYIPIQINVTPMITQSASGVKFLKAKLEMSSNYDMTAFGNRSNVSDATGIVEHFVRKKLDDLRHEINSQPAMVAISEVEKLSGFTPEWIKLSPQGDIWFGGSLKNINTLLPNFKVDF